MRWAILEDALIVFDQGSRLRMVTQGDHAHFAAELLTLWLAGGLSEHPRREEILFAAREHDNGWREVDAAPRVDLVRGRPFDVFSFPPSEGLEVWSRCISRYSETHPLATLLIAEHAKVIHQPLSSDWVDYLAGLEPQRSQWLNEAEIDEPTLQRDYRFVHLADTLSLALCAGKPRRFQCLEFTAGVSENVLQLKPFPLAGATTLRVPCRWIPDRPYRSDSELGRELARAPWQHFEVRVVPV
jgi:hypothetical protein